MSLSSGSRSALAINPENPAAEALRAWWDSEGRSTALTPISNEQRCAAGQLNAQGRIMNLPDAVVGLRSALQRTIRACQGEQCTADSGTRITPRMPFGWPEAGARSTLSMSFPRLATMLSVKARRTTHSCIGNGTGSQGAVGRRGSPSRSSLCPKRSCPRQMPSRSGTLCLQPLQQLTPTRPCTMRPTLRTTARHALEYQLLCRHIASLSNCKDPDLCKV